jgi:hypothetical protein
VKVGDLIVVRLDVKDPQRARVPGIILQKFPPVTPPTYEVLVAGERWVVTHKDICAIDD